METQRTRLRGIGGRETQKERNAESSKFRIIKSESHQNTKQRRVPEKAKERERGEGKGYAGRGVGSEWGGMERFKETVRVEGPGQRGGEGWEGGQVVEALGGGSESGWERERWATCTLWGRSFGYSGGAPIIPRSCSLPMAHQFAPSVP